MEQEILVRLWNAIKRILNRRRTLKFSHRLSLFFRLVMGNGWEAQQRVVIPELEETSFALDETRFTMLFGRKFTVQLRPSCYSSSRAAESPLFNFPLPSTNCVIGINWSARKRAAEWINHGDVLSWRCCCFILHNILAASAEAIEWKLEEKFMMIRNRCDSW